MEFSSLLIGALITESLDLGIKHVPNIIKQSIKKKKQHEISDLFYKEYQMRQPRGQVMLDHGVPGYKSQNLTCILSQNNGFYYPVPQEYHEPLETASNGKFFISNYSVYEERFNCLSNSFEGIDRINKGLSCIGLSWNDETKREIEEIAAKVAQDFISDLASKPRFNGPMLGVEKFTPTRTSSSEAIEEAIAIIRFYETDYFTFRVFSQLYQKHPLSGVINTETINKIAFPFLCSFGVAIFAILSKDDNDYGLRDDDIIVLGRRSEDVIDEPNKIHFPMNEAFSVNDRISSNNLSFESCAKRGFEEELNWNRKIPTAIFRSYNFMDFGFNNILCQMGLSGFVKIIVDDFEQAKMYLETLYTDARDRFEIKELIFIPLKELRSYYDEHLNEISTGLATALNRFLIRYSNGCF